jgi:hypothetical protein
MKWQQMAGIEGRSPTKRPAQGRFFKSGMAGMLSARYCAIAGPIQQVWSLVPARSCPTQTHLMRSSYRHFRYLIGNKTGTWRVGMLYVDNPGIVGLAGSVSV